MSSVQSKISYHLSPDIFGLKIWFKNQLSLPQICQNVQIYRLPFWSLIEKTKAIKTQSDLQYVLLKQFSQFSVIID